MGLKRLNGLNIMFAAFHLVLYTLIVIVNGG